MFPKKWIDPILLSVTDVLSLASPSDVTDHRAYRPPQPTLNFHRTRPRPPQRPPDAPSPPVTIRIRE